MDQQQQGVYSLAQLDQPKACETPYEFEVKDDSDNGTGFFLSVIGGQAKVVTDFIFARAQAQRVQEALDKKADPRDKRVHVTQVMDDVAFATKMIAIRVVSWRGATVAESYSPENAVTLCQNNPWSIREQILAKSEDMKNFPIGGRPSSSSTSVSTLG